MSSHLAKISESIKAGEGSSARSTLDGLLKGKLPRKELADIARLCWRSNMPHQAIRILHPIVRPPERKFVEATDAEKAEYAVALVKAGAIDEGLYLLKEVDKAKYPQALLYEAFGLIARWDYAGSIPILQRYDAVPSLDAYQRLVGEVNLAAAYVFTGDLKSADQLLDKALGFATGPNEKLARARLLQLRAEALILKKEYASAKKVLNDADACLADRGAIDHFFIRKYQAVIQFFEQPSPRDSSALDGLREEAKRLRHWETLRDLEKIASIKLDDRKQFAKVLLGTPHPAFRDALLKQKPAGLDLPEFFEWRPEPHLSSDGPVLDLSTGTWKGKELEEFKAGMGNHRLLCSFCSDLFRPFRVAALFGAMFPGEKYIPGHSSMRLRKAVSRLRQWLKAQGIPLEISDDHDEYRLYSTAPIAIRFKSDFKPTYRVNELLVKLQKLVPLGKSFTSNEAAELLAISQRMAQRLLTHSLYSQNLTKSGKGKRTFYCFK